MEIVILGKEGVAMAIEYVTKMVLEFLRDTAGISHAVVEAVTPIGEVYMVDFTSPMKKRDGFVIVTVSEPRVVGFKWRNHDQDNCL